MNRTLVFVSVAIVLVGVSQLAQADVYNIKVVTDASPDYSDMESMIHSITAKWDTPEEKLWAMFYWNHLARRQTSPMYVHGVAVTDPVRQFNDYGFTMCSTISGINCAIWDAMGFPVKYWDISNHTVPEVMYGGRWHMYDNSLSALYTLCDGVTIAGVEDIGASLGCEASGGVVAPGHIAKYHCLTATSANGFLSGSDTARSLDQEYRCFNPNGLKYRSYFYDWDRGHRYILNLQANEVYTRYYQKLGDTREFYVPNKGKDPDDKRFKIRGNGVRTLRPALTAETLKNATLSLAEIRASEPAGIEPSVQGQLGEAVFKVESSNVMTSLRIKALFERAAASDVNLVAVSTTNGLTWKEVWRNDKVGPTPLDLSLIDEVNGAYEVLVKISLLANTASGSARLREIEFETSTMLNSKTQPQLHLGKNTVYVGAGEQTGSIVFWPDLQGDHWEPYAVEAKNILCEASNPGYQAVMHAERPNEEAFVVFRIDAPNDLTTIHYGGRLYNRAPKSRIDFLHSFDGGATWTESYSLTDTAQPWDVIHYADAEAPAGVRSVWLKYRINSTQAGKSACGLYSVRMEANHKPSASSSQPIEVAFTWDERQADYTVVERSHVQLVKSLPMRYTIDVGGADHPVVKSLRVNLQGAVPETHYGYSDNQDVGGERSISSWVTYGENIALGKPYTVSIPSSGQWGSEDPEDEKLTDGVVGPPFAGGINPSFGLCWNDGQRPEITVDLGAPQSCGAFRINVGGGWPWWDALEGEVKDTVEVLTSMDGSAFTSQGFVDMNLRRKDLPANFLGPDNEKLEAHLFELILPQPVTARCVRYVITARRAVCVNEVQALDFIRYEPFDLRIALPDEQGNIEGGQLRVSRPSEAPRSTKPTVKNHSEPLTEPQLDPGTLHSLGVYWVVDGDNNKNACVALQYRVVGAQQWSDGAPLFRVEKGAQQNPGNEGAIRCPAEAWLFAGSVLMLQPGTEYELRLRLSDPDGGNYERTLLAQTKAEPTHPGNMRTQYVIPGTGGGNGTKDNPFRGLIAADQAASPGDCFLVGPGVYAAPFTVTTSGTPEAPIIWRGVDGGEVVIEGGSGNTERGVSATGVHDVWFERLGIQSVNYGIVAHDSSRIVVRRCQIRRVNYGLTCTRNDSGAVRDFYLSDNVIEGPSTWPRTKGIENARGIQITGAGHVVCYNRIRGFADAIDTFPSRECSAIDFHNNDISVMTDDGIEMDYSFHNTRCFWNRLTNVYQGISVQPVYGGPVYIFRNVIYNVVAEPIKMHNSPSGVLVFHNTSVRNGMALCLMTGSPVRNSIYRNNLFIGTSGNYAYETTAPMVDCDFDYDGFGGGPFQQFLKWNGERFQQAADLRNTGPVYRHAVALDADVFMDGVRPPEHPDTESETPELRLKSGCGAVDAGQPLPGFNDACAGSAPDLGAYELDAPTPWYGPRIGTLGFAPQIL